MTHEIPMRRAVRSLRRLQAQREVKQKKVRALLGDGAGNLDAPNGVPWLWARLGGDVNQRVQAYNATPLIATNDMSVTLIALYSEGRVDHYEIQGLASDVPYANYNPSNSGGQGLHHLSHEQRPDGIGGSDPLFVYSRAMVPLRVTANSPADLGVYVEAGWYTLNGVMYWFAGESVGTFTPPVSGVRYDGVYIDAEGAISFEEDVIDTGASPMTWLLFEGRMPIGGVQLFEGQTGITENDLLQDPRPFLFWSDGGAVCEIVTNGDATNPEIVFVDGDVVYTGC